MKSLITVMLAGPAGAGQGSSMQFLLMMVLIIVVFYFFMIRPQMRKQKELKKFRENLKNGEKIITTGGIYGKIAEIREGTLIIEVEDKVRLKVDINSVVKDPSDLDIKK